MTLTETERIILKNTNKKYKYIARDESGDLYLYDLIPIRKTSFYDLNNYTSVAQHFGAFNHMFQDIKWEDEEPLQFRNDKGEFVL